MKRKRSCQREFMTVGVLERSDPLTQEGCRNKRKGAGGNNLSTRRTQRFLAEAESNGVSAKNARSRR